MIKIKGLYKTYNYKKNDAFEALHNVSIEIEKGSMTAVIGKSGSGKLPVDRIQDHTCRTAMDSRRIADTDCSLLHGFSSLYFGDWITFSSIKIKFEQVFTKF